MPAQAGLFEMPNIKQQARRVQTSAREHRENIRWRSTAKTLFRRLERAVEAGDSAAISEEHRNLVRWLDRASARGAIHPNKAARKKAQAARLVSGPPA